jgi:hypothetical protein
MNAICVAALLHSALFAADPKVERVVSIDQPNGWKLEIRDDGSANLRFNSEAGSGYNAPAGTFDAEQVRKTLLALPSATRDESRRRAHYLIWFEAERLLAPEKEPPSHFTQNEAVLVPLFEKAAEASGVKATPRGKLLLSEKPFRLPPEATRRDLFGLHTPSGWMLSIRNDGSAQLVFGDGGGNTSTAPAGTFQPEVVRKTLDGLNFDPKGSGGTHFVVWHEEMRQSPTEGPAARYSLDESVIVPLFEKAASARDKRPNNGEFEQFGRRRPAFGLGK